MLKAFCRSGDSLELGSELIGVAEKLKALEPRVRPLWHSGLGSAFALIEPKIKNIIKQKHKFKHSELLKSDFALKSIGGAFSFNHALRQS
ncbi:MAG: hypothetical protein KA116_00035 [Proteobacteria bacterium]|nr:hypothetical protein [Pseudomonadota bacterium]